MFEDLLASPNVWIEKGWIGKEVFREDFSYADKTAFDVTWNSLGGGTGDITFSTIDGHLAGTKTIVIGNNVGNDEVYGYSKNFIKYNPKSIYEIEIRIKSSGSGNALQYAGFVGYASDKTTKINTLGADDTANQHYVTLLGYNQTANDKWETYRGYVTGHSTTAATQSNNINTAVTAYTGIEYISPMFLVNYNDVNDISQIDYIVVREYISNIPNSKGWYSTLNRNYYVPVVIKDATVTTFDNEGLQRCTLNYIESKAKRTIE